MHTHTHKHTHTHTHANTHIHTYGKRCAHTKRETNTHKHTLSLTHTPTHSHIHTYTYIRQVRKETQARQEREKDTLTHTNQPRQPSPDSILRGPQSSQRSFVVSGNQQVSVCVLCVWGVCVCVSQEIVIFFFCENGEITLWSATEQLDV